MLRCGCGGLTTVLYDGRCLVCARIWLNDCSLDDLRAVLMKASTLVTEA